MKRIQIETENLSETYLSRALKTGIIEIFNSAIILIVGFLVSINANGKDVGLPILASLSILNLIFAILGICISKFRWKTITHYSFIWNIVILLIYFVLVIISLTANFAELKCRFEVKIFCKKSAIIAIISVLSIIFITLKMITIFMMYMMKKELNFSFTVESSGTKYHQTFEQDNNVDQLQPLDESMDLSSSEYSRSVYDSENTLDDDYTLFVRKFNGKPKDAIKYILQSNICKTDNPQVTTPLLSKMSSSNPESSNEISINQKSASLIAKLLSDKKISKIKLGYYLGIDDSIPRSILNEWIKMMDFSGKTFIEAMKLFLNSISLPPETEKIDRLLESFAKHYQSKNQDIVGNSDAAYILAVAILMLHTDAHSPKINKSNKMTKAQFIHNLRGLNNGEDFPNSFLSDTYDIVVAEEIMMSVVKRGYLEKHSRPDRGGISNQWKRRYFIITSDYLLYYFKKKEDKEPRLIIPLDGINVSKAHHSKKKPYCFVIHDTLGDFVKSAKKRTDGTLEVSTHENFLLSAVSEDERNSWIESINSNVSKDPVNQILKRRLSTLSSTRKTSRLSLFENY